MSSLPRKATVLRSYGTETLVLSPVLVMVKVPEAVDV